MTRKAPAKATLFEPIEPQPAYGRVAAAIEQKMRQIVEGVCMAHGVRGRVSYDTVFEVLVNAPEPSRKAAASAGAVAGEAGVDTACAPVLASEDFAHMANMRPGCFVFAGNGTSGANALICFP